MVERWGDKQNEKNREAIEHKRDLKAVDNANKCGGSTYMEAAMNFTVR